jgi:hypothetical protein
MSTSWRIDSSGARKKSYRSNPASLTIKAVCAGCNNGWMSQLETQAKPLLEPMILGKRRVVLPNDRARIVSTWAMKTALMAGARAPAMPLDFFRTFYATQTPNENVRVWLGRASYLHMHYIDVRPMRVSPKGQRLPEAVGSYQAVLALGHLVMYVAGWRDLKPNLARVFADHANSDLHKLWPADRLTLWPPPKILTPNGLDELADVFGVLPQQASTAA